MRGEHVEELIPEIINSGSPPHARGTPKRLTISLMLFRITPACAGNTA